jgi:aspartate-semialdehyde dehydrogenase
MRICILGATGLVGRETLGLVARAWPDAELELFASRDQTMEYDGRSLEVKAADRLEEDDAPRGDLALVALDDTYSRRYVPRLVELGHRVVDKSNTYRLDPSVPLVVAGVNGRRVNEAVKLVANPNCTTIPCAMALRPLAETFGLEAVAVSSYQAISGAGIGPLDEFLESSKKGYLESDRLGASFDPAGYAGNTVPHSGKTDDSGFSSEERKLMSESRKILEDDALRVCAQCCRVPVAVGHYMNVWLTLGRPAEPSELETVLQRSEVAPFVDLRPGAQGDGLSALHGVSNRDRAMVGRIRRDQIGRAHV